MVLSSEEHCYREGRLFCEDVELGALAERYGTPAYVYSAAAILRRYREYEVALSGVPHRICFAVKSNSNLSVLSLLSKAGAGFDIVSGGELYRVLKAGADPATVVFSGVGKTADEIRFALQERIHSFNCESESEIELISKIAVEAGQEARIAIRVNPDVDASTHPYISTGLRDHKFGLDIERAEAMYLRAAALPNLAAEGVSCHIGSQLLSVEPLLQAADRVLSLVGRLRNQGLAIQSVDLGGGLGVPYRMGEKAVSIESFLAKLRAKLVDGGLTLMLEPGRSLVAEAGMLLSRVLLVKENGTKTFVVLDAGMNDLMRPALYQAYHEILPVIEAQSQVQVTVDVVGPVCESGDFLAKGRALPVLRPGDLVAINTTGAYGFVLASNYNSRPRPCELLVHGSHVHLARSRETYEDLIRGETTAPDLAY